MKIDNEYSCTRFKEVNYLSKYGVRYSFVKDINGITTWKYKKTPRLFWLLHKFYKEDLNEIKI